MKINKKLFSLIMSAVIVGALGVGSLADTTPTVTTDTQSGSVVGGSTAPTTPIEKPKEEVSTVNKLSISRIAGKNRYETSYKISEALGTYQNMVIASGEDFPDALSSGLLASHLKSPVLLTEKNSVNPYLYSALDRHRNQKYYIIGGEASVSKKVKEDIQVFSNVYLKNIAGKDRYDTSLRVAAVIVTELYNNPGFPDNTAVYDGTQFADALSATPFMYQYENYCEKEKPVTISIKKHSNIDSVLFDVVFGGESFLPKGKEKLRLAGSNRYQTSVEVAKAYKTVLKKDIDTIIIASGESYPDALSAGPLASSKNAAILLTESKSLNKDVKKYIEDTKTIKNVIIVGGESAVSSQVEKDLDSIVR